MTTVFAQVCGLQRSISKYERKKKQKVKFEFVKFVIR